MSVIKRYFPITAAALAIVMLGACAGGDDDGAPYEREAMKAFMTDLDDTAYVIWGNSGSEWDQQGERELYPTTDAGWQELVDAANKLQTLGKDLADDLDPDDPRTEAWRAYAEGLTDISRQLAAAAQEQNKQAVFDQGGVLYQVCRACHGTFPAPEEVEERRPQQGPQDNPAQ